MVQNFKNVGVLLAADSGNLGIDIDDFFITDDPTDEEVFEPGTADTSDDTSDPFNLNKEPTEDPDPEKKEGGEGLESVSSEEDKNLSGQGKDTKDEDPDDTSSPYSSILSALQTDGILPDVDEDFIKEVKTPEDFAKAIELQVEARLEVTQKRIKEALDNGVPAEDITKYERTIQYLETITEEAVEDETDEGEELRKNLIRADYINRGFSPASADRKVKQSFDSGNDVEDAKDALKSNKEFYTKEYKAILDEAKKEEQAYQEQRKKLMSDFQKKVMDTEEPIKGVRVDKKTRQLIMDNTMKPSHKDEQGNILTPLQKYQRENPVDSQYYFGLLYTLTDGFKSLEKVIKPSVDRKTKEGIKSLENKLKNTSVLGDSGNDPFANSQDPQSKITWDI